MALSLLVGGCTAQIPDGKLVCSNDSDCPGGFTCRSSERGLRCYADKGPGHSLDDAGIAVPGDDAEAPSSPERPDGATPPWPRTLRIRRAELGSLGGAREKGPYRVLHEGFEVQRACDPSGRRCITGGIGP